MAQTLPKSDHLQQMLHAPVLPLLFRMSTPSVLAFILQSVVSMAEVGFVSQLGTTPLAAMALLFPGLMLTQMLSNGAIGGAVASSVARALGAGDKARADNLLWHAMAIALLAGIGFFLLYALFGKTLISASGVSAEVAHAANEYGLILFAGSAIIWLMALLSSICRGTGDMKTPALVLVVGSLVQVPLSGALILGWFNVPAMGLKGAVVALLIVGVFSSLYLLLRILGNRTVLRPSLASARLQYDLFADIFKVGALATLSPILTVAIVFVSNSLVGSFSESALAGYGIVSRVEFLLIPLVFGIGAALTALVGTNMGAGQRQRAVRIARTGGYVSAILTGSVGLVLAVFPGLLLDWFSTDPLVLEAGSQYLHIVGPAFAFQGIGFALYFAAQGGGNVALPVAGSILRFLIAAVIGYIGVRHLGFGLNYLFACLSAAMIAYGLTTISSLRFGWGRLTLSS
ncbi:MAG: MATE family efflux transporter [Pseudomonadales bacterium]